MDQVRAVLRSDHDAYHPEQTDGPRILRDLHHVGGKTHLTRLGATNVERLLSHLVTEGQVSASTPRQALNALVVLYREVLDSPSRVTSPLAAVHATHGRPPCSPRRRCGGGSLP